MTGHNCGFDNAAERADDESLRPECEAEGWCHADADAVARAQELSSH